MWTGLTVVLTSSGSCAGRAALPLVQGRHMRPRYDTADQRRNAASPLGRTCAWFRSTVCFHIAVIGQRIEMGLSNHQRSRVQVHGMRHEGGWCCCRTNSNLCDAVFAANVCHSCTTRSECPVLQWWVHQHEEHWVIRDTMVPTQWCRGAQHDRQTPCCFNSAERDQRNTWNGVSEACAGRISCRVLTSPGAPAVHGRASRMPQHLYRN